MDQITVPKAWFERLLVLAKQASNDYETEYQFSSFNQLIGYISSAETIIKMK